MQVQFEKQIPFEKEKLFASYLQEIKKFKCSLCGAEFEFINEFFSHLNFVDSLLSKRNDFEGLLQKIPENIEIGSVVRIKFNKFGFENQYVIAKIVDFKYHHNFHWLVICLDRIIPIDNGRECHTWNLLKIKDLKQYTRLSDDCLRQDPLTEEMVTNY